LHDSGNSYLQDVIDQINLEMRRLIEAQEDAPPLEIPVKIVPVKLTIKSQQKRIEEENSERLASTDRTPIIQSDVRPTDPAAVSSAVTSEHKS
jgi:hypothetical protein